MSHFLNFLLLLIVPYVTADPTCIADMNFAVVGWKLDSTWVAQGIVNYNDSTSISSYLPTKNQDQSPAYYDYGDLQSDKPKLDGYSVHVAVAQCSNCENEPYVNITAYANKNQRQPRPDYDLFPGVGNYKFHTKPTTWDDARKICNAEGTHLAVINSETESQIFKDYLANVPRLTGSTLNDFAYIGFHDRFLQGVYLTILDEPLSKSGFFRWFTSGQPDNNGGDEFCGSVHRNGGLNDISCNLRQPFICEQELC